ncbi:MAG: hypothetical protein QOI38_889 [Sphingomonadales bacterium]|nr:hypothetical protein [Sphingomonadales bacterium]
MARTNENSRRSARSLIALVALATLGGCDINWAEFLDRVDRIDRACVYGYRMERSLIGPPRMLFFPRFQSGDDREIPRGMYYRMSVSSVQTSRETPYIEFHNVTPAQGDNGLPIRRVYETRSVVVPISGDERANYIVRIEKRPPFRGLGADRPECYARTFPSVRIGQ